MALQRTNWQDLGGLATLLRDSGDRVLNGNSKLRLTPALLSKLNAAFTSISLLGSNGDFQVTSAHASQTPTTAQLHFLHDFVQKTVGLTISGNGNSKGDLYSAQAIDLSRFRSLRHLELRSVTLSQRNDTDQRIEGLSSLRFYLEALVLVQVFQSDDLLWEVLADGAVSIGPDVIWAKLSQLVVSYCGLRSLGRGISLACNLQWVDVSHNMIADANAVSSSLAALPKLCYLNLSYNRLTKIPVPSFAPSCPMPSKIQILLLSHNYIEDLSGLENLTSVRELNLEVNQLQDHSSLLPLRSLYQLQHIKLKGNPISYHKRYRIIATSYLSPRAVFVKHQYRRDTVKLIPFMLDGQKLTETELQAVRDGPSISSTNKSESSSSDLSISFSKPPETSKAPGSEMERSTRKSRKVREVIIEDFDTLDELTNMNLGNNPNTGSIESSGEHLQTKRELENYKAKLQDNYLIGSTVPELLGFQRSTPSVSAGGLMGTSVASISSFTRPPSSSTPLPSPGLLPSSTGMAVPYLGHLDEQQLLETIISKTYPEVKDNIEASQTTLSTQYHTANDSDTVLHISTGNEETASKDNLPSPGSVVGYDGDIDDEDNTNNEYCDEDLDTGDHSKYFVRKLTQGYKLPQDIALVATSRFIKEIDPSSGRVVQSWRLNCLESCELLSASPCQVQLTFNTVVPSKKKRVYEMDPDEAQKQLLPSLKTILESRSLSALNVAAFRCMKCSGEFSIELNSRKTSKICPTCGSTLVFELDEAPLPSLGSPSFVSPRSEETLIAESSTLPPCSELLHSPSDSSIGSAVSLESPGNTLQQNSDFSSNINPTLRRCESDIDIISNPSQSSIEILDDVSRSSGTPGRKRSSEERQVVAIPSLVTVPEVTSTLAPLPAGLTESSSSGSITDSVCTAYENNIGAGGTIVRRGAHGLAKSVLKEEPSRENSPRYSEEPIVDSSQQSTSLSNVYDNLLQTMSSKISASENSEKRLRKKRAVSDNMIYYDYVDFSAVDHRLKLHLHLAILDADECEVIQLLLRGEVLTSAPENRYPGILVISSQKVYIMKITGPEESDRVDRWISRVVAVPLDRLYSISALPWNAGILISLQSTALSNLIIVVQDPLHTTNFFTCMKQLQIEPSWKIQDSPSEKHSLTATGILQDIVRSAFPDADLAIKLAALLCSCVISKDDGEKSSNGCLIVVTETSLLLNSDDLSWLIPADNVPLHVSLKCIAQQSISNLIQVESNGDGLWLQFLDEAAGGEEVWKLTLPSETVLEQIVEAIRAPWEELFSVPLQVVQTNKL
ncbi:serine/threonine-protein kinase 11-interacting protein isoform X2 [Frankliniella occidentalis]|uniref:Serine/threonine-protein kinase 11-interacting protein isoform X2 n=1 Tax=Frankliniella occidentalis TaxID=133901 RepID=A0A6J1SBI0_FRAOC|nr:serine/threonine-protein kinase 11-interacting protein isoform X2 [Frankliniella occidentalis]